MPYRAPNLYKNRLLRRLTRHLKASRRSINTRFGGATMSIKLIVLAAALIIAGPVLAAGGGSSGSSGSSTGTTAAGGSGGGSGGGHGGGGSGGGGGHGGGGGGHFGGGGLGGRGAAASAHGGSFGAAAANHGNVHASSHAAAASRVAKPTAGQHVERVRPPTKPGPDRRLARFHRREPRWGDTFPGCPRSYVDPFANPWNNCFGASKSGPRDGTNRRS